MAPYVASALTIATVKTETNSKNIQHANSVNSFQKHIFHLAFNEVFVAFYFE